MQIPFLMAFALFVLFWASLPWVAIFKLPNKPAWLMGFYLIGCAHVTLAGCIANSFWLLDRDWVLLLIHGLLGGIGWMIWSRVGKRSVWPSSTNRNKKMLLQWTRDEPVLTLFVSIVMLSYLFAFVQIIMIPQNNIDSLSVHLARIGFWRQYGSFFPWQTYRPDQVWYPVNAQLQTYWTLLFLGSDRLVGIIQWLAVLVCGVSVFGMAGVFGYSRRQSAFAGLIFLSFPLVALQSTTTQTDMVTAAFFMLAVYFAILGMEKNQYSLLVVSTIAVGLGFGVKKSYILLLPILAVIVLLILAQYRRRALKLIVFWSFSLIASIALFGAYIYVVNWHYWGNPFGSSVYLDGILDSSKGMDEPPGVGQQKLASIEVVPIDELKYAVGQDSIIAKLVYNASRLMYQALDTSGLPRPLDGYVHKVKLRAARVFVQWIGFEDIEGSAFTAPGHKFDLSEKNINEESHAWYGPLSVLLLYPLMFAKIWQGIRRHSYLMLAPGLALLVFLPLEIVSRPGWDPFQGRYFAPLIALGSPLMADWFRRKGSAWHEWLISGSAGMILIVTLLYNPSKPTAGKFAEEFHVWTNDRVFVQTIQRHNDRKVYYMVEKNVTQGATLGYHIPFYFMDYPLFGENPHRRLIPITSPSQVSDTQWLRSQGIDYLLLPSRDGYPVPGREYVEIDQLPGWKLYAYIRAP